MLAEAVTIVAQHAIRMATSDGGYTGVEWGNYPEIGEQDWTEVLAEVARLTPMPAHFAEAYHLLEERATHSTWPRTKG